VTGAAGALANDAARDAAAHEVAVAEARAAHAQETVALEIPDSGAVPCLVHVPKTRCRAGGDEGFVFEFEASDNNNSG
jgi:hypothetical protein